MSSPIDTMAKALPNLPSSAASPWPVFWVASIAVSRMVNLTTLAPDIVAAILDDAPPNHITLFDLAVDPPALWDEQRARVGL